MKTFKEFIAEMAEPFLKVAIRHNGKIHKAVGDETTHSEIVARVKLGNAVGHEQPDYGFINHKGHFLHRDEAMDFAKKHDILHNDWKNGRSPGLTSEFLKAKPKRSYEY